jgi:uncharacterized protein
MLFGAGLVVSGMSQPANVIGFLDFFGAWNPSLLFVMIGAIGVHMPLYWLLRRSSRVLEKATLPVPPNKRIDGRLVLGASLFGIGWGLAGYCPGPAIVSLSSGGQVWVVLPAIVLGIGLHDWSLGRKRADSTLPRREEVTTT